MPVRILIVDDDELSREVLTLLTEGEGYEVEAVDSGDAALLHLRQARQVPEVVLTDLQMPGTAGDELARQLRGLCGVETLLLAMSGSELEEGVGSEFDGFLLKPFTMDMLTGTLVNGRGESTRGQKATSLSLLPDRATPPTVLNEDTYAKLAGSMRASQLDQLFTLCLKDVEDRIRRMRKAASDGDSAAYRREAHAVKGGCGMVGAVELQSLATSMEERGLCDDDVATLDEFMVAWERLRRILIARGNNYSRLNELSGDDAR
ncbi:response regulator [Granulicella sp. S190]|uniref:response regulator n=1 Tax=Granulicella sp. S190 TaxID=1747226 RepID=UPI00131C1B60|nr:response regulator [Granulicella sp. S190]